MIVRWACACLAFRVFFRTPADRLDRVADFFPRIVETLGLDFRDLPFLAVRNEENRDPDSSKSLNCCVMLFMLKTTGVAFAGPGDAMLTEAVIMRRHNSWGP